MRKCWGNVSPDVPFLEIVQASLPEISQSIVELVVNSAPGERRVVSERVALILEAWTRVHAVRVAVSMVELLSTDEIYEMQEASEAGLLERDKDVTEH